MSSFCHTGLIARAAIPRGSLRRLSIAFACGSAGFRWSSRETHSPRRVLQIGSDVAFQLAAYAGKFTRRGKSSLIGIFGEPNGRRNACAGDKKNSGGEGGIRTPGRAFGPT